MNHLMIDLETMGNKPNAAIMSIGAVFFEPATGDTGNKFYSNVLLESETELGASLDAGTIMWWLMQSGEARAAIASASRPIANVLADLSLFVSECQTSSSVQVWGNGATFDNVILRSAYQRTQLTAFWPFWNDRDVRTMVEMGRQLGIDPKRDMPFSGDRHNALDDAIHQAQYVSVIWQKLISSTSKVQP